MGDLTKLLGRVVTTLVGSVVERAVEAITARRQTVPEPARDEPVKLRPVRRAREHHVWESYNDLGELMLPARCVNCDQDQTAHNRFEKCPGRPVPRYC